MRWIIKYFISLALIGLLIGSAYFIRAQVQPPDKIKPPSGDIACDMKKKEKLPKCTECKKLLMGTQCKDCAHNNCDKCKHGLFSNEEIKDKKCPCCSSTNLAEAELIIDNNCFFCNKPIERLEYCVKKVYACPDHPDYKNLKPDKCREEITGSKGEKKECGKKLVLVETSYSEIVSIYVCPKCGKKSEEAGKCNDCKMVLRKKETCKDSGTFPHVSKPGPEKAGENQDKLVMTSQPEVKVFEGTRSPQQKSWTYLLYCPKTKEAALVDASCDADELAKYIDENKLKVKYIFISHGHGDHYVTQAQIQGKCRDAKILRFGSPLKDNDYIKVGELTLKIFHTPGHAQDCIVIWVDKVLFTGDSFDQEVGREETKKRLKNKGTFTIYGGHGRWEETY